MNIVRSIHFQTAEEFLKAISYGGSLYGLVGRNYIFRGHASSEYRLIPTSLRGNICLEGRDIPKEKLKEIVGLSLTEAGQITVEYDLLKTFFTLCDENKLYIPEVNRLRKNFLNRVDNELFHETEEWLPEELYELAALAQHHGVPTRLLDWTEDIHVALYFMATGAIEQLYGSTTHTNAESAFKKEEVLAIARKIILNKDGEDKNEVITQNMELWVLNNQIHTFHGIPLKIIRPRFFENDNMAAQKGLFTLWTTQKKVITDCKGQRPDTSTLKESRPLDVLLSEAIGSNSTLSNNVWMYRISIPQSEAPKIYDYVNRLSYNTSSLFPGYDGVVRRMREEKLISDKKPKVDSLEVLNAAAQLIDDNN